MGRATRRRRKADHRELISIHALRGEGDTPSPTARPSTSISIHALRGEGDLCLRAAFACYERFLSTPSVGRATCPSRRDSMGAWDFYPRPPWGGRRSERMDAGTDTVFLSTPSVGRATRRRPDHRQRHPISIHALRGEGDAPGSVLPATPANFYPRPPWGGRREDAPTGWRCEISIHALRGEGDDFTNVQTVDFSRISIHALRGEGDGGISFFVPPSCRFLSTPSVGRATGERPPWCRG